jgi:hypothetical protein
MTLHFTAIEPTFSYFEAKRRYIEEHGKPLTLCSDKASVFMQHRFEHAWQGHHAIRAGFVRVECGRAVRQLQPGEGLV